jgi:hypothetical protein
MNQQITQQNNNQNNQYWKSPDTPEFDRIQAIYMAHYSLHLRFSLSYHIASSVHLPPFLQKMPKHWTLQDEEDEDIFKHEDLIGAGGYGEVHRVMICPHYHG